MTDAIETAQLQRRFTVHGTGESPGRGWPVEGVSFEDAALHYVEDVHPAPDPEGEVQLLVEDCESGERQCFRIDLLTGETAPCD
ncbi:DUF5961 family protein [Phenylobacterium sp. J367]|uniref:DUF5961 family protein n=1 Tax=Phenylobacterium sp. J367 TaxID=2898435 RepID=UPI0035B321A2